MILATETILIGASLLLLASIFASKLSDRFGIPTLVLFLLVGMLAGSDGPGGIYFDDPSLAQLVGIVALALILFSGGLDTDWHSIQPVLKHGLALSTLGVLITALAAGVFVKVLLGFSWLESLLVGAIVSSTDAAAVFGILRSKGLSLKGNVKPLLELESGSNDPMAIFMTLGLIQLLAQPTMPLANLVMFFGLQAVVGIVCGYVVARTALLLINRLKLGYEGLYPVLTLSLVLFTYGFTTVASGNGFLAVYLAGILMGKHDFIHKRSLLRFHDGLAWLMQIAMFLTLGLLVFPSRLPAIIGPGLLVAIFLMLVARPLSVFLTLLPGKLEWQEKTFLSWVGLRGAVPIILATFPLQAQAAHADYIFNVVFFVVLTSALLQGASVPLAAKWLHLDAPAAPKRMYPLEYTPVNGLKSELKELDIPCGSPVAGKAIVELGWPMDILILLIARGDEFILPNGGTVVHAGDTLLVLAEKAIFKTVQTQVETGPED